MLAHEYRMPVRMLQRVLSPEDFAEERAFYRLEPWGEWRADLRAAKQCAATANFSGNVQHALSPADFMPDFDAEPENPAERIAANEEALKGFMEAAAKHG
jgi:hypothetical protein